MKLSEVQKLLDARVLGERSIWTAKLKPAAAVI